MKRHFLWGLLGSLLFAFVFVACGGSSTASNTSSGMSGMNMRTPTTATTTATESDPMTDSLKNLSGKDFEIKFMQDMIVHHQSAIDMAKLVPTHTKRSELNTLSQNIITAQTKEISEMTIWLNIWYHEKPVADAMSIPGMMDMMGGIDTSKNATSRTR